ncbi:dynamin family protein [Staphylococcus condimenti]|nr:dynamin family protein [Staphylococcus condimenti]
MNCYREKYVEDRSEIMGATEILLEYVKQNESGFKPLENISEIERIQENFSKKEFEIVVTGDSKVGKSTFINKLVNKNVLPTSPTKVITYIKHCNHTYSIEGTKIHLKNGEIITIDNEKLTELSESDLSEVEHLEIFLNSSFLKEGVVIIDTPSIAALSEVQEENINTKIKKASAHIFLCSAEQVGRKAETEFLYDKRDFRDQTLLIANKMDLINPEEEEDVIDVLISNFSLETSELLFLISTSDDDNPVITVKQQLDQMLFGNDHLKNKIGVAFKSIARNYALLVKENLLKTPEELEDYIFLEKIDDKLKELIKKGINNREKE